MSYTVVIGIDRYGLCQYACKRNDCLSDDDAFLISMVKNNSEAVRKLIKRKDWRCGEDIEEISSLPIEGLHVVDLL